MRFQRLVSITMFWLLVTAPVLQGTASAQQQKEEEKAVENQQLELSEEQPIAEEAQATPESEAEVQEEEELQELESPELIQPQALSASLSEGTGNPSDLTADATTFLQSFNGKHEVSLFSGVLNYYYPLWVPQGRLEMTPNITLTYSSIDDHYASPVGFGWSLPINAVYRTPKKGVDETYNEDRFAVDIFGATEELIIIDDTNGVYAPKAEGSFNEFTYDGADWIGVDAMGNTYTFGTSASTRQDDPNDSAKVFKWMLEKVEDPNGNFMTFTYTKDNGAIYPNTIRYTGYDTNDGIFEVKFNLESRDNFVSYRTGFRVSYEKLIDSIDLVTYSSGSAQTFLTYDFTYTKQNNAIWLLDEIEVTDGTNTLPSTTFEYFSGSDAEPNKKINGLKTINEPLGGTQKFTYKPSTAYREQDSTSSNWLPFVVHTVYQHTSQAGSGEPEYTTTYDYRDGHYYVDILDVFRREYAGFGKVTITDPVGNIRKLFFHQSQNDPNNDDDDDIGEYEDHVSKKGRIYRDEQWDDSSNLRKLTINKWDKSDLSDNDPVETRHFPFLTRTTTVDYGENSQSKAQATTYTYDSYGNVTEQIDYGEVTLSGTAGDFTDTGSDKITTDTEYAYNTTNRLLRFPKLIEREDQSATLMSRQKLYYDELSHGSIDTGNLTKVEDYKNASQYVTTETSYTAKGLPETITNPRSYDTDIAYDDFDLYPDSRTNAKTQETTYEYSPEFGVVTKVTDPNGGVQEQILDGFGRVTEQKVKAPGGSMKTAKDISYDLSSSPVSTTETSYTDTTDNNSNAIEVTQKTYLDGFGRPIQVKQEAEGSNYVVVNTVYDARGNVKEEYLPQFTTTINHEAVTTTDPKLAYTYDTLNRVKTITSDVGTTTTEYNDWSKTITDAESNEKDFTYDARGNLIQVTEYLSSTGYDTDYTYDANNNLLKIEDADGNEKELTYDLLGRKLTEELFHDSSNGSPDSYTYVYDDNGNVTSRTDAKSQAISYTYDELDRPLTENTTEVVYTYDSGTNGIGHLTSVDYSGGGKDFEYDILGRLTSEEITIDSTPYETQYSYDLLGNLTGITYPDSTTASYVYNNAAQLEEVTNYVDDIDYAPTGAISFIEFNNGITTTNTYDENQLYWLTQKVTTDGVDDLQNISYTFDNVGNITNIDDNSDTDAAKDAAYVYDDLYRLTSATITNTANTSEYTRTYSYDIIGNITNKSDIGAYSYTGNHPHAVTSANSVTYSYDANGSLTGDGTWIHTYDIRNRLTNSDDGSTSVDYQYDEARARTLKTDGTTTNVYANKYYEEEDDGSTNTVRRFIYAGDMKIAKKEGAITTFIHNDHLSGSNISTDATGATVELNDYYPYGDSRIQDRATGYENDYTFTGQEHDEETGQYYYGARYYNSGLGRFTSQDPLLLDEAKQSGESFLNILFDPQQLNAYSYVANNPLNSMDPTGESILLFPTSPRQDLDFGNRIMLDNGETYNPNAHLELRWGTVLEKNTLYGDDYAENVFGRSLESLVFGGSAANFLINGVQSTLSVYEQSYINENWGNTSTLDDHFNRHGGDFGSQSKGQYVQQSQSFYKNRQNYNVKIDDSGITRVYDSNTNTFGAYNADGTTKTYFKPSSGQKYFDSQPGNIISNP